jgi:ketosteroid isomerase-like protein
MPDGASPPRRSRSDTARVSSERNAELHRRWFEAYNARDTEALLAYCDPEIVFHSVFAQAGGAVYHGHDGMRKLHQDFREAWGDEIRFDADAYFEHADHTLVFGVLQGRGRHSGVDVTMTGVHVARWRGGLMVYAKGYDNREDALSDLGVTEDELEPIAP